VAHLIQRRSRMCRRELRREERAQTNGVIYFEPITEGT